MHIACTLAWRGVSVLQSATLTYKRGCRVRKTFNSNDRFSDDRYSLNIRSFGRFYEV